MQYNNRIRDIHNGAKGAMSRYYIRLAAGVLMLSVLMYFIFFILKNIISLPLNLNFLIFLLLITQGLNIIVSSFLLSNELYHGKDNQILLSLAVKNSEIYFSKILVFYLFEVIRNLYVAFPLVVGLGITLGLKAPFYIFLAPILLILPVFSILVAAIIATLFVSLTNIFKKYPYILLFVILAFMSLIFYGTYIIITKIPYPIRIVQLYTSFITSITIFIQKIASYGFFYTFVSKILFGQDILLNMIYMLSLLIFVFGLVFFLARPFFFKLTNMYHDSSVKAVKIKSNSKERSVFRTIFKKELLIALRSPIDLLSSYATLLLLPFFMFILNYIYYGMMINDFGNSLIIFFDLLIILLIATTSNSSSATAITREGLEFSVMKTAPSKTSQMAWAKLIFNLTITATIITISFGLFFVSLRNLNTFEFFYLYLFTLLINSGHIILCFNRDIAYPTLSLYAQSNSLDDNSNVAYSLTSGILISIVFSIMVFLLLLFKLDHTLVYGISLGVGLLFLLINLVSMKMYLKAYFNQIEY
jgi:ABC-2 type transport system permease protein